MELQLRQEQVCHAGIDVLKPSSPYCVEIPSWVNSYGLISLGLGLSDEPYEHVQGDSVLTVHGNGVTNCDTAVVQVDGETGRPIIRFDGSGDYIKVTRTLLHSCNAATS